MGNSSDYGYDDYRDYHPDWGLQVRLAEKIKVINSREFF